MFLDIETKRKMNPAAVQDNGAVLTYGELTGFAREALNDLPYRSLVFILCKNTIGSIAGYIAIMTAGCVPLLLGADIDRELLQNLISTYDPDYIWMPQADVGPDVDHWNSNTPGGTSSEAIAERDAETARQTEAAKRNAAKKASSRTGMTVNVTPKTSGEVVMDRYDYDMIRLKPIDEIERLTGYKVGEMLKGSEDGTELAGSATNNSSDRAKASAGTGSQNHRLHPDLGLLMTTSGSTGSPKLVRQSLKNVIVNAAAIGDYLEIGEFDRAITTLPMSYTYGLSVINSHIMTGATLLLTDLSIMQREFWTFFNKEKATSIAGVPYTYEMLKKLKFMNMMLPSLKVMTQAGGRLRPDLHKEFAEFADQTRRRFYVMYGQTEATARMSYVPYVKSVEKCGSIGVAIPGGKLSIIDESGNIIEKSHVAGELIYEGSNVTYGYATQLSDLAKGDENKGVLHTGDMAEMDDDGYFYIVGRKKRFLKIYGNRVGLDECESLIENHFQVECACTGEDDLMKIYVTGKIGEAVIIDFIAEKTALNPKAFEVHEVDKIPRSGSGKKAYGELEG